MLERFVISGSNSLPHIGKVQSSIPGCGSQSNASGLPRLGGEGGPLGIDECIIFHDKERFATIQHSANSYQTTELNTGTVSHSTKLLTL